MDSHPSVAAALPESCVSLSFPSEPSPPGSAIDPVAPSANSVENRTAEFTGASNNAEDGAQENQRRRRPFRGRGRFQFRGWYGKRWGLSGLQAKFHHHPILVDTGAIYCHDSDDAQHGNSTTVVESFPQQLLAPQVVPIMNHSTTGEESIASRPPPPSKPSLPLSWCDICRVDCNSLKVLEKHITGKRHKRTVQLLEKMEGRLEMLEEEMKPEQHDEQSVSMPIEETKVKGPPPMETSNINCDTSANPKKKRKRNSAPEQPRVCVLCNSVCNSQAMFESHLAGKKHAARLSHFQRPNTVYGLMSDYIPPNQSSTSASQDTQSLYYGLMNCEQPPSYAVLDPHLEQPYECKEHLPLLDSEGQCGFIES